MPLIDLGEQPRDVARGPASAATGPDRATAGDAAACDPAASAVPPQVVPASVAVPDSPRAKLAWVLASAESLAVSGALLAFATCISNAATLLMFIAQDDSGFVSGVGHLAFSVATGGLLAAGFGLGAILRLRADTHPLTRGLAGSAVLLGLLLLVVAAYGAIQASGTAGTTA